MQTKATKQNETLRNITAEQNATSNKHIHKHKSKKITTTNETQQSKQQTIDNDNDKQNKQTKNIGMRTKNNI